MTTLKLRRRIGEQVQIGEHITVTLAQIRHNEVLLAIEAPKEVPILRDDAVTRQPKTEGKP